MKITALVDLIFQILLVLMVSIAGFFAKKGHLKVHCTMMRVAVPIQIVAVLWIMLPAMLGYVRYGASGSFLNIEVWIHHILGLIVIVLWILINLVFLKVIRFRVRLLVPMRAAFVLWLIVLALGIHLYVFIWV
jgi:hypothetical protein